MSVTSSLLAKVMTDEQRDAYLPAYHEALAKQQIIKRKLGKLRAQQAENDQEVAALEALTGGLGRLSTRNLGSVIREIGEELRENWMFPFFPESDYSRLFTQKMIATRMPTEEDLDKYAVKTVAYLQWTSNPIDPVQYWLEAIYDGDVKAMVEREAEALGFERKPVA